MMEVGQELYSGSLNLGVLLPSRKQLRNIQIKPSFVKRQRSSQFGELKQRLFRNRPQEATANKLNEQKNRRDEKPLQQWRRMARIVRILCAVCIALRKYAMEAGLMDNYMVEVAARKTTMEGADGAEEELTFNLLDFKINRELKVPKSLQEMMEKRPDWRTTEEVHAISRLMRNLISFRKYTHDMQLLMSRIVRYMKCGKRRVVLRKGHIGYSVYFVYSGSVSVVLDKDEQNVFTQPEKVILRKGACFGEIALVQNTRRQATIVCAEETEFLVIDKDEFVANGLDTHSQAEFNIRKQFLSSWEPLLGWTDQQLNDLTYISRTEDFNHNKVIVTDSRKNDYLWFVIKGSCEVMKLVDLEKSPDYRRLMALHNGNKYISKQSRTRVKSAPCGSRSRSASLRPQHHHDLDQLQQNLDVIEEGDEPMQRHRRHGIITRVDSADSNAETNDEMVNLKAAVRMIMEGKFGEKDMYLPDQEPVNTGIYMRLDVLRDGMFFGLEGVCEDEPSIEELKKQPRLSIISKGCTVIHIPRTKIKEMLDDRTLKCMKSLLKTYPTDAELCDSFLYKSEWDHYKHSLVESIISDHQNNVTFENSLRNIKQVEYVKQFEDNNMTSQFYMPLTSQNCSPLIGSYTVHPKEMNNLPSRNLKAAIERRRPKTAAPARISEREKILVAEETRYNNTANRRRLSSAPPTASKRSGWSSRLAEYTSKTRPHSTTSRRLTPELPSQLRNLEPVRPQVQLQSPNITRPNSASNPLGHKGLRGVSPEPQVMRRERDVNGITVNKRSVLDGQRRPPLVLAQPLRG